LLEGRIGIFDPIDEHSSLLVVQKFSLSGFDLIIALAPVSFKQTSFMCVPYFEILGAPRRYLCFFSAVKVFQFVVNRRAR
jgi:hypothetical protein